MNEQIVILDFGSQYSHLIARRVRDVNVYCEIIQIDDDPGKFTQHDIKGIILSGGTFGSPQLLMLSGIGPATHLKEHYISV